MPGRRKKQFGRNFRKGAGEGAVTFHITSDHNPLLDQQEPGQHLDAEGRLKEQEKYGIYYDDDYDYLQHLKDPESNRNENSDKQPLQIDGASPISEREEVYVLSPANLDVAKPDFARPLPDWDADIVAALENDWVVEELEDDFMTLAGDPLADQPLHTLTGQGYNLAQDFQEKVQIESADDGEDGNEDYYDCNAGDEDDVNSDVAEFSEGEWSDEEEEDDDKEETNNVKSKDQSLARNKYLQLLDEHTDVTLDQQYTEDQIGGLDCDDLQGRVTFDSDVIQQSLHGIGGKRGEEMGTLKELFDSKDKVRPVVPESWKYVEDTEGDGEERVDWEEYQRRICESQPWKPPKPQWDCETILSTLSNSKNIPKTFDWPLSPDHEKKKRKHQPVSESESMSTRGLTLREIDEQRRAEKQADSPSTFRPDGETAQEKRERKSAVKQYKRERREEKKMNKIAFRAAKPKQTQSEQYKEHPLRVN